MVFNGLFDRYPNLKVAFLEGGVAWFLMALERFTGSYASFRPYDPRGEYLMLQDGETVADYVIRRARAGRIAVGVEGDEPALAYAVKVAGPEAFIYSSDFPHEVNVDSVRGEIDELLANEELTDEAKSAILHGNAARFYGFDA
jgi:predicted TIM-barrel fold metal-dependent hydrolase